MIKQKFTIKIFKTVHIFLIKIQEYFENRMF